MKADILIIIGHGIRGDATRVKGQALLLADKIEPDDEVFASRIRRAVSPECAARKLWLQGDDDGR